MTNFTFAKETKAISTSLLLSRAKKEITQLVIRDAEGKIYAIAPADWPEDDVAAQVAHLNSH